MTVEIRPKFSKPSLLLGADPKATALNGGVSVLIFCLFTEIMLAVISFAILQAVIFYKTYKNPFFLTEVMVFARSLNLKAKTKKRVENYV